jgi:hypothetical protein
VCYWERNRGKNSASNDEINRMLKKVNNAITAFAALFVMVLAIAAWLDRSIIILHLVEALPFIAGPLLCLRRNKFGYALCFAGGAFWLWTGGFLTAFVHNGFELLKGHFAVRAGSDSYYCFLPHYIQTFCPKIFRNVSGYFLFRRSLARSWF